MLLNTAEYEQKGADTVDVNHPIRSETKEVIQLAIRHLESYQVYKNFSTKTHVGKIAHLKQALQALQANGLGTATDSVVTF